MWQYFQIRTYFTPNYEIRKSDFGASNVADTYVIIRWYLSLNKKKRDQNHDNISRLVEIIDDTNWEV